MVLEKLHQFTPANNLDHFKHFVQKLPDKAKIAIQYSVCLAVLVRLPQLQIFFIKT